MNNFGYILIFALILLLLLGGVLWAQQPKVSFLPGDQQGEIIYQGQRRHFLVHIPEDYSGQKGLPLVIALHGGGGNPKAMAKLTGFSLLADEEGFVVVYPQAVNRHWNDGRGVKRFRSHREEIDDVGFISALIDTMVTRLAVDPERIYATGISNGGMMSLRLGCELSSRLAAIAAVAASMPEKLAKKVVPQAPLSVLLINGTQDPIVPYEGGGVGLFAKRGRVLPVEKTVEFWVLFNRCKENPSDTLVADKVRRTVFAGGAEGTEVVLYTIADGGHIWPGGARRHHRFGSYFGEINATRLIWDFFSPRRRL